MITEILTARHQHHVKTLDAHRAQHEAFIAANRAQGFPVTVSHNHGEALVARINHGRWVAMCPCGAGVAVDPDWTEARCFGCGTVHHAIAFPVARVQIEEALLEREHPRERHWQPGETVEDLRAEHAAKRGTR